MSDELPPPRRAEKKAQSRRRIVDAAREVFFRVGFMEANLDEVAKKAGVAKGTLYRYFDSKAELYVAVLAHNGDIFVEKMRDAVAAGGPAPDLIRRLGSFYFTHWTQHPDYFQIFWAIENQSVIGDLPSGVIEEVTKLWERCVEQLAKIIEQGVREGHFGSCDAWEVADILWTLANGLIQTQSSPARRSLRKRPLDATFKDALDLVIRGLAPTDEAG
jgi:AcrR family transcriptional regulator